MAMSLVVIMEVGKRCSNGVVVPLFEIFRNLFDSSWLLPENTGMNEVRLIGGDKDWIFSQFPSSIRNLSYLLFFVAMARVQYDFSIATLLRHNVVTIFILSSSYCCTITTGCLQIDHQWKGLIFFRHPCIWCRLSICHPSWMFKQHLRASLGHSC